MKKNWTATVKAMDQGELILLARDFVFSIRKEIGKLKWENDNDIVSTESAMTCFMNWASQIWIFQCIILQSDINFKLFNDL